MTRDRLFIAVHHGGPLDLQRHRLLTLWAAACAERVLPLFESVCADDRPGRAIEMARAWGKGEIPAGVVQRAAIAAHRAAREAVSMAAEAAARAAGHAVAAGHLAHQAPGAAIYALRAIAAAGGDVEAERAWQLAAAPEAVRHLIERRQLETTMVSR